MGCKAKHLVLMGDKARGGQGLGKSVQHCNNQSAQLGVQLGEFLQTDHTLDNSAVCDHAQS